MVVNRLFTFLVVFGGWSAVCAAGWFLSLGVMDIAFAKYVYFDGHLSGVLMAALSAAIVGAGVRRASSQSRWCAVVLLACGLIASDGPREHIGSRPNAILLSTLRGQIAEAAVAAALVSLILRTSSIARSWCIAMVVHVVIGLCQSWTVEGRWDRAADVLSMIHIGFPGIFLSLSPFPPGYRCRPLPGRSDTITTEQSRSSRLS